MILSLWFWGRKLEGRRSLVSVGGVFPLLFLLLLAGLAFVLPMLQ